MLEALETVSLTGNILQFIDFGLRATSKYSEIYSSATSALEENIELEYLVKHISRIAQELRSLSGIQSLDDICSRCVDSATELLGALDELKVSEQAGRIQSMGKVVKSLWGAQKLENMRTRLEGFRNEIQFSVLIELRSTFDVESTKSHARYNDLNDYAKAVLENMSIGISSVHSAIQEEGTKTDKRIEEAVAKISAKQESTQIVILESTSDHVDDIRSTIETNSTGVHEAIRTEGQRAELRHHDSFAVLVSNQKTLHDTQMSLDRIAAISREDHETTRLELAQVKIEMTKQKEDMAEHGEELKRLNELINQTSNPAKREKFKERGNVVTAAYLALSNAYDNSQKFVASVNIQAKTVITSAIAFQPAQPEECDPVLPRIDETSLERGVTPTGMITNHQSATGLLNAFPNREREFAYPRTLYRANYIR